MGNNVEDETSASFLYTEDGDRKTKILCVYQPTSVNHMTHVRIIDTAARKENLTKITSLFFYYLLI